MTTGAPKAQRLRRTALGASSNQKDLMKKMKPQAFKGSCGFALGRPATSRKRWLRDCGECRLGHKNCLRPRREFNLDLLCGHELTHARTHDLARAFLAGLVAIGLVVAMPMVALGWPARGVIMRVVPATAKHRMGEEQACQQVGKRRIHWMVITSILPIGQMVNQT